jgi:hypothetical protein
MNARKPDIYERATLQDGTKIALSIWLQQDSLSINVSLLNKKNEWERIIGRNLWLTQTKPSVEDKSKT